MSRGFQCQCVPESCPNNVLLSDCVCYILLLGAVQEFSLVVVAFKESLEQLGVDDAALRVRLVEPRNFAVQ